MQKLALSRYAFLAGACALFVSFNVAAKPMRGPAAEAGAPDQVINLPAIDIYPESSGPHRVPRGEDAFNPTQKTPKPNKPATPTPPAPTPEEKALKELEDAARALMIKEGDPGLQNTSLILDWLIDRFKDVILGPVGELLDALEPDVAGQSDFDKARNKAEMNAVRKKIEIEEKELSEKNKKALEENTRKLIPEQLRFQNAIKGMAKLRSDDLAVIADYVFRRTRADSPAPASEEMRNEIARVLRRQAPANMCQAGGGTACVLKKVAQGANCYCPKFRADYTWVPVQGKAGRRPTGQYCRNGDAVADLQAKLPVGVGCYIPVDVTVNPMYPRVEFLRGRVSKVKCGSDDGYFDPSCR